MFQPACRLFRSSAPAPLTGRTAAPHRDVTDSGVFQMIWGAPAGIVSMTSPRRKISQFALALAALALCAPAALAAAPTGGATAPDGGGSTSTTTSTTTTTTTTSTSTSSTSTATTPAKTTPSP